MRQSLGLVEIAGLACAVVVADALVKSANVELMGIESAKGMGYTTIKVVGDVGAVNAAVEAGCQMGRMDGKLVSWKVIPRPSDALEVFLPKEKPVAAEPIKETPITEKKDEETAAAEEKSPETAPKKKDKAKKKSTEDSRD